ncbi:MAG: site-2 protease family protein [Acidobacteria bacterium]|nr:site-2 protease family protein [Acidobacteriota bacterium]
MEDLPLKLTLFAVLLVSLSIHEAAHAWAADKLGDPTARLLGRLTFNPIAHIDPIGTLLLPGIAILTNLPIIGWAKPVPVNLTQLKHPRRDFMYIAAAGPASNLLQALILAGAAWVMFPSGLSLDGGFAGGLLAQGIFLNVLLALFNLIPVPPLDGGNVIGGLLPERVADAYDRLVRPWGFLILYGILLSGLFATLIVPPAITLTRILLP